MYSSFDTVFYNDDLLGLFICRVFHNTCQRFGLKNNQLTTSVKSFCRSQKGILACGCPTDRIAEYVTATSVSIALDILICLDVSGIYHYNTLQTEYTGIVSVVVGRGHF